MASIEQLTQDYVKSILDYNPETGLFVWKYRPEFSTTRAQKGWNTKYAGKIAGNVLNNGYRVIVINYLDYLAHRLAWFYMMGKWPMAEIDHINGMPDCNNFANIREATSLQNKGNTRLYKTNTSGHRGVYFNKRTQRWQAYISINNKHVGLGTFKNKEDASAAYKSAAEKRFGEFVRNDNVV